MKVRPIQPKIPSGGVSALGDVELTPQNRQRLENALEDCSGPPAWRGRKQNEARDILALSQIALRLRVEMLDLSGDLRVVLGMRCPVSCMAPGGEDLRIGHGVLLGLAYPEELLTRAIEGYRAVRVFEPRGCWHPNIARDPIQPICLGVSLPIGIRATELILMTYGALTFQNAMLDPRDHAGVMNVEAARWWLANRERLPLSSVPFLGNDDLIEGFSLY